jgi:subtilase family serine protease
MKKLELAFQAKSRSSCLGCKRPPVSYPSSPTKILQIPTGRNLIQKPCPETDYKVSVDGTVMVIGGTSAVAPLWSELVALLNQKLKSHALL